MSNVDVVSTVVTTWTITLIHHKCFSIEKSHLFTLPSRNICSFNCYILFENCVNLLICMWFLKYFSTINLLKNEHETDYGRLKRLQLKHVNKVFVNFCVFGN